MSNSKQTDDKNLERELIKIKRAYFDFKKKVDDLSRMEHEVMKELRERLEKAEIEKMIHQIKDS